MTYVGAGMICPHIVNISTLLGAIISWGIMWPLISKNKGDWYPAKVPESSMKSLYGYKVSTTALSFFLSDNHMHKLIAGRNGKLYVTDHNFFTTQAFICIALIMGDGMYHFIKIVGITAMSMYRQFSRKQVDNKGKNKGQHKIQCIITQESFF